MGATVPTSSATSWRAWSWISNTQARLLAGGIVGTSHAFGDSHHVRGQASVTALHVRATAAARGQRPDSSPRAWSLPRSALLRFIDEVTDARLVLFEAPAGFGKSVAMRQYRQQLEREGQQTAWLTLGVADNDLTRFSARMASSLRKLGCSGVPGDSPTGGVDWAAVFADALALVSSRTALFLDDFEVITDPLVLEMLRRLELSMPPSTRLVVGSRRVPKLALGKLRARGHLVEIDQRHLRFSLA